MRFVCKPDHRVINWYQVQRLNQYLREEYHQLQDILWKSGYSKLYADMPARRDNLHTEKDACRVHGTLTLNKVAGNFHVTAGKVHPLSHPFLLLLSYLCSTCSSKVLPIMGAHAHMTGFMEKGDYNFSHRSLLSQTESSAFSYSSPNSSSAGSSASASGRTMLVSSSPWRGTRS